MGRQIWIGVFTVVLGTSLVAQQPTDNASLRRIREQQRQQQEERARRDEENRKAVEALRLQKEQREQAKREADAKARADAEPMRAEKARREQATRDADAKAREEANQLNDKNKADRAEKMKPLPSDREPAVVQRRETSRAPKTEWREVGGHGTPVHNEMVTVGYRVTYKLVWDNGTSTTETVDEPAKY